MIIRRISIENIKSIAELEWKLAEPEPGWHVILGNNGSGKSTFLRCVSLALLGPRQAQAARQQWKSWLPPDESEGQIAVDLIADSLYDQFSGPGRIGQPKTLSAAIKIRSVSEQTAELEKVKLKTIGPERHVWGTGAGWFSAAYGPFRRFAGGDKDAERTYLSNPSLGAHISVFGENAALSESLFWLRELNYQKLENPSGKEAHLLAQLKSFLNQDGFLPYSISLKEISSRGVDFEDANGCVVSVEDLSDGYRSILSMTLELIRRLSIVYDGVSLFNSDMTEVSTPGIVLIDEIDAHLHPSWQRVIGFWLTRLFPKMQFLVTTHSPLICHAASESGTIFKLPTPGEDEEARFIVNEERTRLIYGDIIDGLNTAAFNVPVTRSDKSQELQQELASLNVLQVHDSLTSAQRSRRKHLRQLLLAFDQDTEE